MWHLLPSILYITYVQAQYQRSVNNPYAPVYVNERAKLTPTYLSYPDPNGVQNYNVENQYADYSGVAPSTYNYAPPRRSQYVEDPYVPKGPVPMGYYLRNSNLRQPQFAPKIDLFQSLAYPFDLDYAGENADVNFPVLDSIFVEEKDSSDKQSYFNDLELTENFANYLKRRTQIDSSSISINDAAHQFNALLTVLMALARVIRNSCADFDQIYDQVYSQTVETYYNYGLANADKVSAMIEDFIRKGNSRMPKIKKLKQNICDKELFCSTSVDNYIKSSPLIYVKELETLEALVHLARTFYPYTEEFNQAAQKGTVLHYLQKSKDRIKEYIMHVINSVEHLTDRPVTCP